MINQPSTEWREIIAPNEEQRYAQYAEQFSAMQQRKSAKHGSGRGLHRKQILGLPATLEVLGNLPAPASAGLFAKAGIYQTLVRLSLGGPGKEPDKVPGVRGFALNVQGVQGESALGGTTNEQHFSLINQESFGLRNSDDFAALVASRDTNNKEFLKHFFRRYGLFGGFSTLKRMKAILDNPFYGFAANKFFSAVPIACGKYAIRLRLVPHANNGAPATSSEDWAADMIGRLEQSSLSYDFQVQFFINEKLTPIENGSVNWEESNSPYTTVARLTIPRLSEWANEREALQTRIEAGIFDPWCALAEHRPLGDIMRARKVVYYQSQKNRNAVA